MFIYQNHLYTGSNDLTPRNVLVSWVLKEKHTSKLKHDLHLYFMHQNSNMSARITKHFRPRFKKTLVPVKPRF